MRRIRLAAAHYREWSIEDRVKRGETFFQRCCVNVHLERAAYLTLRLCGPVELRVLKTIAPDHRFYFARAIIDGDQGSLRAGDLFQRYVRGATAEISNIELRDVAHVKQLARQAASRPSEIGLRENGAVGTELYHRRFVINRHDQAVDVISLGDRPVPVVVIIILQRGMLLADDIGQIAAPAMPSLITVQPISHRGVGGALCGHVERGINPQPVLVHRLSSISGLQIFADLFHKVRR